MAVPQKIINFLEQSKCKYELVEHKKVYTAFDKAQTLRLPQKVIGKTLVAKLDNKDFVFVLVPANRELDKARLKKVVNKQRKSAERKAVKSVNFATEAWIKKNLKGMKVGAMPPFGPLWKLPTFADSAFLKNTKIIVSGGDYNWSIKISPSNLKKALPDSVAGPISKPKK